MFKPLIKKDLEPFQDSRGAKKSGNRKKNLRQKKKANLKISKLQAKLTNLISSTKSTSSTTTKTTVTTFTLKVTTDTNPDTTTLTTTTTTTSTTKSILSTQNLPSVLTVGGKKFEIMQNVVCHGNGLANSPVCNTKTIHACLVMC